MSITANSTPEERGSPQEPGLLRAAQSGLDVMLSDAGRFGVELARVAAGSSETRPSKAIVASASERGRRTGCCAG